MRSRILAGFLLGVLVTSSAPFAPAAQAAETTRIVVEVADGESDALQNVHSRLRSERSLGSTIPRTYYAGLEKRVSSDLRRWKVLEVPEDQAEDVLSELQSSRGVVSARREHVYEQVAVPNDPDLGLQYGLPAIHASEAWDKTKGSSSTVIAIIDGGVDISHEDLSSKIWTNDDVPGDGIDNDGNGFIDDTHGWDFIAKQPAGISIDHATHVAGIAAAAGNNNIGVAGVDWGARIMSVRVLGTGGRGGETAIIDGINYAVANGADVINLSIAGSPSSALAAAIENAYASGVVVVAASGNNGANTDVASLYPVCAETEDLNIVLGVGAFDDEGEPASFSNYGKCVDVSAPGKQIYSTKAGNDYGKMSGTSMAAPFVAGAAGLYIATHPGASPAEVINAIMSSSSPFTGEDADDWNAEFKGKLNVAAAIGNGSSSSSGDTSSGSSDESSSSSNDSSSDGGGGGSDSGGGGGNSGGGGEEPQPTATPKPKVAGTTIQPNRALLPKINAAFREVFGRNPNTAEHSYWYGRVKRGEKRDFKALVGAMRYQAAFGRTYIPAQAAVKGTSVSKNIVPQLNALFRSVYSRTPTLTEHAYWLGRVIAGDKTTPLALTGAMLFHRLGGITH